MPNVNDHEELDALIIGAGFFGVYQLHHLRDTIGLRTKIFEAAPDFAGIWYWNRYPGARVDSDVPVYEFSDPQIWKGKDGWKWKERYPGWEELRSYFKFVDERWGLRRDVRFNTRVKGAEFDEDTKVWRVQTEDGMTVKTRFLILCTGFGSKPYVPSYPGLGTFEGKWYHTARWPQEGVQLEGKRVAVFGTGATGVQVIQEIAAKVGQLTVFQRTPNMALPMKQCTFTDEELDKMKDGYYEEIFEKRKTTFAGFPITFDPKEGAGETPEQQTAFFESIWEKGGFNFWLATYSDMYVSEEVNNEAYAFWRKKVLQRITKPELREKLAPEKPPHAFGTKRPSLERTFYEKMCQDNVTLVDLKETPVQDITPKGVRTSDGKEYEFDVIVFATGFDAITGGITNIDIKGTHGKSIEEVWKTGTRAYLGMSTAHFPNLFFLYGPQAPTAFCNGATCAELQGQWMIDFMSHAFRNNITRIEATEEAEEKWKVKVNESTGKTLFAKTDSWYMGANVPGKVKESLNWTNGVPDYVKEIEEVASRGYEGYVMTGGAGAGATASHL